MVYIYPAVIHEYAGIFYAAVPDISGCATTGYSLLNAVEQIADALSGCLCVMEEEGDSIAPPSKQFDVPHKPDDFCTLIRVDTATYRSIKGDEIKKSMGVRKQNRCVVEIETSARLLDFAAKHRMPGFYFDANGLYCLNLGRYLLTVFENDLHGGELEVSIDEISSEGVYDMNIEWITPSSEEELVTTIHDLAAKYGRRR